MCDPCRCRVLDTQAGYVCGIRDGIGSAPPLQVCVMKVSKKEERPVGGVYTV